MAVSLAPEERDRLVRLEAGAADMHADIHEIKTDVKEVKAEVSALRDAWNNRPSWFVSLVIGALMSSTSALAVIALVGR